MEFVSLPILSPAGVRPEQLVRLAYELLDAHLDTEQLMREPRNELQWQAHRKYLGDLQRVGREILATQTATTR